MEYLAHSANNGCGPQAYADHIRNVRNEAVYTARETGKFASQDRALLENAVHNAAEQHDLGKLELENQEVLHRSDRQGKLPVNHVEAGAAALAANGLPLSSMLVYAHHKGLPDLVQEELRGDKMFRSDLSKDRAQTDAHLPELLETHRRLVPEASLRPEECPSGNLPMLDRLALSCLADADHSDTARASGTYPKERTFPQLLPEKRLKALEQYISGKKKDGERGRLRQEMYRDCRNAEVSGGFVSCDSPVGSGKTLSVMAHMLHQASRRGSRRIFVVLPFTNIITQSVEEYRNALVLPGEAPDEVVAEIHSRVDFDDPDLRYLTALWKAPVIVTTAVAFFETLASNRPSTLRRLHNLPGSMIFLDEAHAALPIHLLGLAWRWMQVLADEWGCYWILASGSLVHFWELSKISKWTRQIPELVSGALRSELLQFEHRRIRFPWYPTPLSRKELEEKVMEAPGPRLLIVNTIRTAAVIAKDMKKRYGKDRVEHLSTALTPRDRAKTIGRIKERLKDPQDRDWVLVATSCVEAGMDFSFRTGFRQIMSLLALLQAAGRVCRNGEEPDAEIWSFTLQDDPELEPCFGREDPGRRIGHSWDDPARILENYFRDGVPITPELSTDAFQKQLIWSVKALKENDELQEAEEYVKHPTIAEKFRVIDERTVTAVVDSALAERIANHKGNWQELQLDSVSIPIYQIKNWDAREISDGLYQWMLPYDGFLGYMAGVLEQKKMETGFLCE